MQEFYLTMHKARIAEIERSEETCAEDDGIAMFHIARKYVEIFELFYDRKQELAQDCSGKALNWFEKGSKLKANSHLCKAGLAYCYQEGIGVRQIDASAKKRYSGVAKDLEIHAEKGDMYSAYFLACYNGEILYNWAEKDKWLTLAATLGHADAQCKMANGINNKILNSKEGHSHEKVNEMVGWLNKAVAQNYARGYEALAFEYYWGKRIPIDKGKAKELYEKAAELGCEMAMMILRKHDRFYANAYSFNKTA